MIIIALGCADKHVHNFRSDTLYNYISEENFPVPTDVICSGGISNWKNIPESTIMANRLKTHGILENFPNITLHEENLSTDTAKNIRNSVIYIIEKKLTIPESLIFFTSHFHIERTRQFAEYIIPTEFSHLHGINIKIITAEDFASESHKRHLLNHPAWKNLHEEFIKWEQRGLAKPVEEREYNKPLILPTFK